MPSEEIGAFAGQVSEQASIGVLLVHGLNGGTGDVVPARDGEAIYRLIGSPDKELVTLRHSYHVVTKDYEHEQVFTKTLAFVQRIANQASPDSSLQAC